jgi:hypothetical protein
MFRYLIPIAWLFSGLGKKAVKKPPKLTQYLKLKDPKNTNIQREVC